ncbi:MAG: 5'/3'-nucleotidase SurE [Saprospiraceae bacterium]|nr:5'/3'-nucleotidase SurE [Saprospiraceae bacterium]
MSKPLILVTNDDGILAPGLKALVGVASRFGEVVVVAPDSPQSGQGHAITLESPLRLRKVHFDDIDAYECSGTPVDCVKLAKNVLLKDRTIDLCLSGINHGANSSINVIYSGTMSAAMEASLEGVNSIGFSLLDYNFDADFTAATSIAETIVEQVLVNGLPPCKLLNVNIPSLPATEIKGMRVCRQGNGSWIEDFQEGLDPRGEKYYWLTGRFVNKDHGEDTDIWALANGYVSIVPTGFDLTVHGAIPSLKYLQESAFQKIMYK